MITAIKEQLKDKIKEICFNYDNDYLWKKEMLYIEGDYWGNYIIILTVCTFQKMRVMVICHSK